MSPRHTWVPEPSVGDSARSRCSRCGVLRRVRFSNTAGYTREWSAAPEGPWDAIERTCEPKEQGR